MISLSELDTGKAAMIKHIEDGHSIRKRLEALGIRIGKDIKKVTAQPFKGPLVIEVEGIQIAIERSMAAKIFVEATS